ncbi:MAG: response regulator transcription factor [Actinomycetota bacterium]|nr:response regulator transcription factor [Actinomycetota bacterium]
MSLSVVVVEDEPDIADLLALYFRREGWTVHLCSDGAGGLDAIRARQPDFVVLDIGLPGDLNGLDVCREVRARSDVPVLMLTARDDEIDRILGLELGADDYVTKPFSPREVVARVKAILRRGHRQSDPSSNADFGAIAVDLGRRVVEADGKEVALASQEWSLLEFLLQNSGIVLSRQQILDGAWGSDWFGDPRTIDVHIRQLRRKLGPDLPLATVRGVGYRLG